MTKLKGLLFTGLIGAALLILPSAALADTVYTVVPGDSLWKISNTYGVSIEQIENLNNLSSSMIYPGQSLVIDKNDNSVQTPEVSRSANRMDIILGYAKTFLGCPYIFGGESPQGFDCSGYVQYIFKHFGIELPRTAGEQYYSGTAVSVSDARPGDIVAFKTGNSISHTGIYVGGGMFISASSHEGISIASIYGPYWNQHFYGFSRII